MAEANEIPASAPENGEVDIAALANEIVRLRKSHAFLRAAAKKADAAVRDVTAQLKEANARLLEALNGPRKQRTPAAVENGARWPLGPNAKSLTVILDKIEDIGAMHIAELSAALPQISKGALYQALKKLRDQGMIEKLADGSYGLTDAQQAAMRPDGR